MPQTLISRGWLPGAAWRTVVSRSKLVSGLAVLISFIASAIFVFAATRKLNAASDADAVTRSAIDSASRQLADVNRQKSAERYATEPQSAQELPGFVNAVRGYADPNHVQIVRWMVAPIIVNVHSNEYKRLNMPDHVTPLTTFVQVRGSYAGVRAFLYGLLRSPRLFTLNELKWTRGVKPAETDLAITVTRYLET